jgi:hypothetical protein
MLWSSKFQILIIVPELELDIPCFWRLPFWLWMAFPRFSFVYFILFPLFTRSNETRAWGSFESPCDDPSTLGTFLIINAAFNRRDEIQYSLFFCWLLSGFDRAPLYIRGYTLRLLDATLISGGCSTLMSTIVLPIPC